MDKEKGQEELSALNAWGPSKDIRFTVCCAPNGSKEDPSSRLSTWMASQGCVKERFRAWGAFGHLVWCPDVFLGKFARQAPLFWNGDNEDLQKLSVQHSPILFPNICLRECGCGVAVANSRGLEKGQIGVFPLKHRIWDSLRLKCAFCVLIPWASDRGRVPF